ncbi:hypothetical protein [Pseudomonas citronellolis]|uniref:hypothetical protein n=1 Tax=Pseudomonas citronellolis TaxID=53408 RepID=UPI00248E8661|nr:hypothetical protein [Pseudomonas citronellolis]
MTNFEYIRQQIAECATSKVPLCQISYVRGLIDMAERTQAITTGESMRLGADLLDQDHAYTNRLLGRTR